MDAFARFDESLGQEAPPDGLPPALAALWWLRKDGWDQAHDIVQDHKGDPACDSVHALLHRMEGDTFNARYWYSRAGRPVPDIDVSQEAAAILNELLQAM